MSWQSLTALQSSTARPQSSSAQLFNEAQLHKAKSQYNHALRELNLALCAGDAHTEVTAAHQRERVSALFSDVISTVESTLQTMRENDTSESLQREWRLLLFLSRKNCVDFLERTLSLPLTERDGDIHSLYALSLDNHELMLDLGLCELPVVQSPVRLALRCGDCWTARRLVELYRERFLASRLYRRYVGEIEREISRVEGSLLLSKPWKTIVTDSESDSSHSIARDDSEEEIAMEERETEDSPEHLWTVFQSLCQAMVDVCPLRWDDVSTWKSVSVAMREKTSSSAKGEKSAHDTYNESSALSQSNVDRSSRSRGFADRTTIAEQENTDADDDQKTIQYFQNMMSDYALKNKVSSSFSEEEMSFSPSSTHPDILALRESVRDALRRLSSPLIDSGSSDAVSAEVSEAAKASEIERGRDAARDTEAVVAAVQERLREGVPSLLFSLRALARRSLSVSAPLYLSFVRELLALALSVLFPLSNMYSQREQPLSVLVEMKIDWQALYGCVYVCWESMLRDFGERAVETYAWRPEDEVVLCESALWRWARERQREGNFSHSVSAQRAVTFVLQRWQQRDLLNSLRVLCGREHSTHTLTEMDSPSSLSPHSNASATQLYARVVLVYMLYVRVLLRDEEVSEDTLLSYHSLSPHIALCQSLSQQTEHISVSLLETRGDAPLSHNDLAGELARTVTMLEKQRRAMIESELCDDHTLTLTHNANTSSGKDAGEGEQEEEIDMFAGMSDSTTCASFSVSVLRETVRNALLQNTIQKSFSTPAGAGMDIAKLFNEIPPLCALRSLSRRLLNSENNGDKSCNGACAEMKRCLLSLLRDLFLAVRQVSVEDLTTVRALTTLSSLLNALSLDALFGSFFVSFDEEGRCHTVSCDEAAREDITVLREISVSVRRLVVVALTLFEGTVACESEGEQESVRESERESALLTVLTSARLCVYRLLAASQLSLTARREIESVLAPLHDLFLSAWMRSSQCVRSHCEQSDTHSEAESESAEKAMNSETSEFSLAVHALETLSPWLVLLHFSVAHFPSSSEPVVSSLSCFSSPNGLEHESKGSEHQHCEGAHRVFMIKRAQLVSLSQATLSLLWYNERTATRDRILSALLHMPSSLWCDIETLLALSVHTLRTSLSVCETQRLRDRQREEENTTSSETHAQIPLSDAVDLTVFCYQRIVANRFFLAQYDDEWHEIAERERVFSEGQARLEHYKLHVESYFNVFEHLSMELLQPLSSCESDEEDTKRSVMSVCTPPLCVHALCDLASRYRSSGLTARQARALVNIVGEGMYARYDMRLTKLQNIVVRPAAESESTVGEKTTGNQRGREIEKETDSGRSRRQQRSSEKEKEKERDSDREATTHLTHDTAEASSEDGSLVSNNDYESILAISLPRALSLTSRNTPRHTAQRLRERENAFSALWRVYHLMKLCFDAKLFAKNELRECYLWVLHLPVFQQVSASSSPCERDESGLARFLSAHDSFSRSLSVLTSSVRERVQSISQSILSLPLSSTSCGGERESQREAEVNVKHQVCREISRSVYAEILELGIPPSSALDFGVETDMTSVAEEEEREEVGVQEKESNNEDELSLFDRFPFLQILSEDELFTERRHSYLVHYAQLQIVNSFSSALSSPSSYSFPSLLSAVLLLQNKFLVAHRLLQNISHELSLITQTTIFLSHTLGDFLHRESENGYDNSNNNDNLNNNRLWLFEETVCERCVVPLVERFYSFLEKEKAAELDRWFRESLAEETFLLHILPVNTVPQPETEKERNSEKERDSERGAGANCSMQFRDNAQYIKSILLLFLLHNVYHQLVLKTSLLALHLLTAPPSKKPTETPNLSIIELLATPSPTPLALEGKSEENSRFLSLSTEHVRDSAQFFKVIDELIVHLYSLLQDTDSREKELRKPAMQLMIQLCLIDEFHKCDAFAMTFASKLSLSLSPQNVLFSCQCMHRIASSLFTQREQPSIVSSSSPASLRSSTPDDAPVVDNRLVSSVISRILPTYTVGSVTGSNKHKLNVLYQLYSHRVKLACALLDRLCESTVVVPVSESDKQMFSLCEALHYVLSGGDEGDILSQSHSHSPSCVPSLSTLVSSRECLTDGSWTLLVHAMRGLKEILQHDKLNVKAQCRVAETIARLVSRAHKHRTDFVCPLWATQALEEILRVDAEKDVGGNVISWERALHELRPLFDKNRPQVVALWAPKSPSSPWEEMLQYSGKFNRVRKKCMDLYLRVLVETSHHDILFQLVLSLCTKLPSATIQHMLISSSLALREVLFSLCRYVSQRPPVFTLRLLERTRAVCASVTVSRKGTQTVLRLIEDALRVVLRVLIAVSPQENDPDRETRLSVASTLQDTIVSFIAENCAESDGSIFHVLRRMSGRELLSLTGCVLCQSAIASMLGAEGEREGVIGKRKRSKKTAVVANKDESATVEQTDRASKLARTSPVVEEDRTASGAQHLDEQTML